MSAVFSTALGLLVSAHLSACSSLKDDNAPPSGLQCEKVVNGGGDAQSLTSALASAPLGSCVLVVTQTYTGNFKVPAGVTLVSAQGSRASFVGTDGNSPAIDVAGGAASGVQSVDVTSSAQVGIAVRNGAAHLQDIHVTGAKSAAVAALCTDAGSCHDGAHQLELDDVHLTASSIGLWTNGEDIHMTGGESSQNTSESLTGGEGVVAFGGAHVTLDGANILNNDQAGVLFDGTGGTTGDLKSVTVSQNGARGVWAQHLAGTIASPALTIEGASTLSGNKIVGLGATDSHGIIFVGGKIENTVAAPIVTNFGDTEQVGDGFGMFNNSGDVKLDTTDVSGCARAAGLIDTATGVIIFVGGTVEAGPSNLKIVVQNTSSANIAQQQIPADTTSTTPSALYVDAPEIALGSVIQ